MPFKWNPITNRLDIASEGSSGSIVGPGSSTDEALMRWNGISGELAQDSTVILNDSGDMTGVRTLTVDGLSAPGIAVDVTAGDIRAAAGSLRLPSTTSADIGVIKVNAISFIHAFGTSNTFVGASSGNFALTGQGNTGVGSSSLTALTSGTRNVGIGPGALSLCTGGNDNVAIGNDCLDAVTTSNNNVGVGTFALGSCTSSNNVAVGQQAGSNLVSNGAMTAIGYSSLNLATGDRNTAVGHTSLDAITTGERNTALGALAGTNTTTGSNNIYLGHSSGSAHTTSEGSNILIGSSGVVGESNTIRIGTNGAGTAQQNRAFVAGVTGVTVAASAPVGVNSSSQLSSLGFGTSGQVLTSTGAASSPTWQDAHTYATGTWTPTMIGSGTAGTPTYGAQVGRYTRIGDTVFVEAGLRWTAHTGTGNMTLGGLPFTVANVGNLVQYIALYPSTSTATVFANPYCFVRLNGGGTGGTPVSFNNATGAVGGQTLLGTGDLTIIGTYRI